MDDLTDQPLYLLAVIRPRVDSAEATAAAEAALRDLVAGTLREPGCITMELTVDEADPTTWVMFEKFRSRADWEAHMQTEHVLTGNALLVGLLREPTELRFFSPR